MANRTLTINHADGDSETYTINRDKFAGVRDMTVDGATVSVDHTAVPKERSKETTFGGSQSITVKRDIEPLLSKVAGGASVAYSLRDLNDKQGNNKVVRVRRGSDNAESDFTAKEVSNGTLTGWVNAQLGLPLDLQELTDDGRTGAVIPAAAAYSLRNLSSSYSGDVVEVRRSSNDTLKSFKASEVADGTLRNFCLNDDSNLIRFADAGLAGSPTTDKRMYFDGVNDYVESNTTTDASSDFFIKVNLVWFGDKDQTIFSDRASERLINLQVDNSSDKVRVQVQTSDGYQFLFNSATDLPKFKVVEVMLQHTASTKTQELFFDGVSQGSGNYTGTITPANTRAIQIGSEQSGSGRFFKGIISDFNYNNETIQLGYGSTSTDWEDTVGSNNGTVVGSPAIFTGQGFDGHVKTWYDQSGNSRDAVQVAPASQPKIVDAGSLVEDSGIGGLDFDGDDFLVASLVSGVVSPLSIFSASVQSSTGYTGSFSKSSAANRYFGIQETTSTSLVAARNSTSVSVSANASGNNRLTFAVTTGETSTSVGAKGGTLVNTTNDYGNDFRVNDGINQLTIGVLRTVTPTGYFNGHIRELIFYTSDQTANREAIEANIGEAYSITGIPAYDNTVDGFVETWYDQSGNGNDAVQAVAESQPKIVDGGSLVEDGIQFDGVDDVLHSPFIDFGDRPNTMFTLIKSNDFSNNAWIVRLGINNLMWTNTQGERLIYAGSNIQSGVATSSQELWSALFDNPNDTGILHVNDTQAVSGAIGGRVVGTQKISIGAYLTNAFNGNIKEIIIYNSDQSANLPAVEANINNQYEIY
jgi:hypothetical protein